MFDNPVDELIAELDRILPPVVARTKVSGYLGGMMKAGYLATLDSDGKGPEGAIRCGRHVGYLKKPFLDWLRKRMSGVEEQRGIVVPSSSRSSRRHTDKNANALLQSLHDYSSK